ncbi:hypothetical protein [Hyphomonas sp.]|uniref:hypothetical protein n=1 Tax=Hyphomonas sp. TaxID=87 RepID=UPI0037BF12DB
MSARDFNKSLSAFRADKLVERMTAPINPGGYNQADENFRVRLQGQLDDLSGKASWTITPDRATELTGRISALHPLP